MNRSGYTGRLFEEEVLGKCRGEWSGYMSWKDSLVYAANHQPKGWDPSDPSLKDANDFHALVAMELGIESWDELRLFSSVHTPLDWYHGVDGFFVFKGKVVTIDVTLNPNKDEAKADFVVQGCELRDRVSLKHIARQVAQVLEQRSRMS